MKYLGLDVHSATSTIAGIDHRGNLIRCRNMVTSAENLIEEVMNYPGKKALAVEESHLAAWARRSLKPYVDRLLVCDPKHNKWIAADEYANDKVDAIKLAQLLRGGYLKEIYHPEGMRERLRSLFLHYYDLNHQLSRFKCKLKAEFRQLGILTAGSKIYNPDNRKPWLVMLRKCPHVVSQVKQFFRIIDLLEELKEESYRKMVSIVRKEGVYKLLCGFPGAGPVVATGYIALIDTPHRFSRKNKLWRYAGLSNQRHSSDSIVYRDRATKTGNRAMKWVVTQHFLGVMKPVKSNRFQRHYKALLAKGMGRKTARRAISRQLLSAVRAMWMKGEPYRDVI